MTIHPANTPETNTRHSPVREPYPGALYGILKVKFVPAPVAFTRRRLVPRVRVFCEKCRATHWLTRKQLVKGTCSTCSN